jgi:hypothetical protein
MEAAEKVEEFATGQQDQRTASRYGVDEEAHILLVKQNLIVPCRILDLSLDGCRLQTPQRLPLESMMCVEVNFTVKGLPFRFSGLVQWTDCQHLAGIRFASVPRRRRGELVETLSEIKAEMAAGAAEWVPGRQVASERPAEMRVAEEQAVASKPAVQEAPAQPPAQVQTQIPPPAPAAAPVGAKPSMRDRRQAFRETVDTSAVIDLIRVASQLPGRILDLSLSGCRIRTDEPFPVGIYTRIEVEFRLDGLPFRLGGVIQGIHDRQTVGIRFLDLSSRKREQVEQLIEEIREKKEAEKGIGNRE